MKFGMSATLKELNLSVCHDLCPHGECPETLTCGCGMSVHPCPCFYRAACMEVCSAAPREMLHVISSLKHLRWTPLSSPDPSENSAFPSGCFTKHTSKQRSSGPKRALSEARRGESRWVGEKSSWRVSGGERTGITC